MFKGFTVAENYNNYIFFFFIFYYVFDTIDKGFKSVLLINTSYIQYENVPKGALYKLEYLDYGNTGQRPFIMKNGIQEFL